MDPFINDIEDLSRKDRIKWKLSKFRKRFVDNYTSSQVFTVTIVILTIFLMLFNLLENAFGEYVGIPTCLIFIRNCNFILIPMLLIRFSLRKLYVYLTFLACVCLIWYSPWDKVRVFRTAADQIKAGMSFAKANSIMNSSGFEFIHVNPKVYPNMYEAQCHKPGSDDLDLEIVDVKNGIVTSSEFRDMD